MRRETGWTDCPAFSSFTAVLRLEPGTEAEHTLACFHNPASSRILPVGKGQVPPSGISVSSKAIPSGIQVAAAGVPAPQSFGG